MKTSKIPMLAILSLWSMIFAANTLFYPFLPVPPSLLSIGICMGGVVFITAPSLLYSKSQVNEIEDFSSNSIFQSFGPWMTSWENKFALCLIPLLFVGMVVDYFVSGVTAGMNLSDVRAAHLSDGGEFSPLRYLSLALKALGLVGISHVAVSRAPRYVLASCVLMGLLAGLVETFTVGGRSFFRLLISILAAALLIGNAGWVKRNKLQVIFGGLCCVLFLLVAAVAFNRIRTTNDYEREGVSREGMLMLSSLGIDNAPDDVGYGTGLVVGYLIAPIGYLDHYLNVNTLDPEMGAFTFITISARFGYDWLLIKNYIDDYYVDVGIRGNIWATAFRELIIDTGIVMFLPICLLIGLIFLKAQMASDTNSGARLWTVMLLAWLLNSPFESILKVRYFEFSFMLSILLWILIAVSNRMGVRDRIEKSRAKQSSLASTEETLS